MSQTAQESSFYSCLNLFSYTSTLPNLSLFIDCKMCYSRVTYRAQHISTYQQERLSHLPSTHPFVFLTLFIFFFPPIIGIVGQAQLSPPCQDIQCFFKTQRTLLKVNCLCFHSSPSIPHTIHTRTMKLSMTRGYGAVTTERKKNQTKIKITTNQQTFLGVTDKTAV